MSDTTERWYSFARHNGEAMYGWGDAVEAGRFLDHLNKDLPNDDYMVDVVSEGAVVERRLDKSDEAMNLHDELSEIASQVEAA